jgi:hypothetical protein
MVEEVVLYEDGLEEYPLKNAYIGNAFMILWFVMGAVACSFIHILIGIIYLLFAFVMVYVVFKKIVCTNCYYYGKRCSLGWGKLSAMLFKQGSLDLFQNSKGLKVAPPTYGLLMIIPLIALIYSSYQDLTILKILVLIIFMGIAGFSAGPGRKKACENCKMNKICPGSAVK